MRYSKITYVEELVLLLLVIELEELAVLPLITELEELVLLIEKELVRLLDDDL